MLPILIVILILSLYYFPALNSLRIALPNLEFKIPPFVLTDLKHSAINTLIQFLITSAFAFLVGGVIYRCGLRVFSPSDKKKFILWLPFAAPGLFHVQLYFLFFFPTIPPGNIAISLIQGLSLGGVLALSLLEHRWSRNSEWTLLRLLDPKGFHRWRLLFSLWRPAITQGLRLIGFFCLTSLSIPLALGSFKGENLEVFLYKYYGLPGAHLALIGAMALQLVFFLVQASPKQAPRSIEIGYYQKSSPKLYLMVIIIYLSLYMIPIGQSLLQFLLNPLDWTRHQAVNTSSQSLMGIISFSILLTLLVSLFVIFCIMILSWVSASSSLVQKNIHRLWPFSASTIASGLGNFSLEPILATLFMYATQFLPSLVRLGWDDFILRLKNGFILSRILNLSWLTTLTKIFWPQFKLVALGWMGIVGTWVFFDFALIRFFFHQPQITLASWTQAWFNSYYADEATKLLGLMVTIWLLGLGILYAFYPRNRKFRDNLHRV